MYNITLVCTMHEKLGKCNADELYQIIDAISPQVIFEELTKDLSDIAYKGPRHPKEPPEVESIKRYLLNHNIQQIPVDIALNYRVIDPQIDFMLNSFNEYQAYREIENEQYAMTEQYGFRFLNSNQYYELFERKKNLEEDLINFSINKNQLTRIRKLFYEVQDTRETKWLENVYEYSKKYSYEKAIFFCGAAHRKSIMQKILELEAKESYKLNWTFYE